MFNELIKAIENRGYLGYNVNENIICVPFIESDIYIEVDENKYNTYLFDNDINDVTEIKSFNKIEDLMYYVNEEK